MKKVIALVLVLIMAASIVACGTQAKTPATAAPAADGSAAAPAAAITAVPAGTMRPKRAEP